MNYHNEDARESSDLGLGIDSALGHDRGSVVGPNSSRDTIKANPDSEVLSKDQNTLIHLDPIPDFKDKSEIKPWLQKIFYPQGIEIVIERSDNIKVVFKCKAARRSKNARENNPAPSVDQCPATAQGPNQKKKRSVSRFNTCTFRIRATFSLKRKKWNIVVLNNTHSHPLKFNPHSDEYKKFKAKLKEDGDWEAVKKFDELEYRTMSNLPIKASLIPCDCGLTNEVRSFNIVLPSTKSSSSNSLQPLPHTMFCGENAVTSTAAATSQQVKKPKSKKVKQQQKRENLLKSTTKQNFLTTSKTHIYNDSSVTGFLDDSTNSPSNTATQFLTMASSQNTITDLNEIDFTNIFNKPLHHQHGSNENSSHSSNNNINSHNDKHNFQRQRSHPFIPNDLIIDQPSSQPGSALFSPLAASSHLYISPSDEALLSPSNHRPSSVTYRNSDSFFDLVGNQDLAMQYTESPSSLKERGTFTDSLGEEDQSNSYKDTCSQYNSVTTTANINNDADLGDVLVRELNEIKVLNSEFKLYNELEYHGQEHLENSQPQSQPHPHPQSQPPPQAQTQQQQELHTQSIMGSQLSKGQILQPQNDFLNDQEHQHGLSFRDFELGWNGPSPNLDSSPLAVDRTAVKTESSYDRHSDEKSPRNTWELDFQNM